MDGGDILTIQQMADYMHCHSSTLYRMIKRKELPCFKIGSDWRFDRRDIDRWLAQRKKADSGWEFPNG